RIFGAITRTTAATTKLAHIQMYGDHNTLNVKTISFYSLLYNFTTRTTHTHTHTHPHTHNRGLIERRTKGFIALQNLLHWVVYISSSVLEGDKSKCNQTFCTY